MSRMLCPLSDDDDLVDKFGSFLVFVGIHFQFLGSMTFTFLPRNHKLQESVTHNSL